VKRFLQRVFALHASRRRPARSVCYARENGPIAYSVDLFTASPRDSVEAMLASGLAWHWRSDARGWTELTRVSLSAFLADISSQHLLMTGTEGDLIVSDDEARAWIRRFARDEPSPLALAISAAGSRQLVFVQQQASAPVNALLEAWQIDKESADRQAYARLGPASLEALADALGLRTRPGA
jgi:hypothetical protein